jgi:diaminopimelate epimerase
MEFVKVHGTGNDFVLLPDLDDTWTLDEALTRALCDRHAGLGADGAIRLGAPRGEGDVFMDYRNADGSVSEMCGNGVRCVAKYLVDRGIVKGDAVRVDTRGGVKAVEVTRRHDDGTVAEVRVDMGRPVPTGTAVVDVSPERLLQVVRAAPAAGLEAAVTAEKRVVEVTTLSMGNPHAVVRVDDVAAAPVTAWGPVIATDPEFPEGTNVEFVAVPAPGRVEGRIWERGVGETRASGTGASAMAVAAHLWGLSDREVVVAMPGGELAVEWAAGTLYVTGSAVEVATGRLDAAWLRAVGGAWA